MTDPKTLELAKRIDGALNFLDNRLMPDAKELARAGWGAAAKAVAARESWEP